MIKQNMCLSQVEFSEMLLPYLVHDILAFGGEEHRDVLSQRISGFFHSHCSVTTARNAKNTAGNFHSAFAVQIVGVQVVGICQTSGTVHIDFWGLSDIEIFCFGIFWHT